jgi:thymidylate synthase (FAD)
MPHNPNLEPKHHAFRILIGQKPLTRFKNYKNSIRVDLINPESKENMMKRIYDFVKATWSEDGRESERATPEQMKDALTAMLSGKALGLGLETINLTFRVSGINRIDTHQMVRQRIGVTFSQQCTGDRFLNHNDALVEPSIRFSNHYTAYVDATLSAKNSYSELVSNGVSIQAARSILPHNLETFIFMDTNLMTLLFFHQKRIDDGSQTWSINEIAQQMADEVCKAYPELTEVFERNRKKFKFQEDASKDRANIFSTNLYLPKDDTFEYHDRDFLYQEKKNEMHKLTEDFLDDYYWGWYGVTKEMYEQIKNDYKLLDTEIDSNHYTNEEIKSKAELINKKYEEILSSAR